MVVAFSKPGRGKVASPLSLARAGGKPTGQASRTSAAPLSLPPCFLLRSEAPLSKRCSSRVPPALVCRIPFLQESAQGVIFKSLSNCSLSTGTSYNSSYLNQTARTFCLGIQQKVLVVKKAEGTKLMHATFTPRKRPREEEVYPWAAK